MRFGVFAGVFIGLIGQAYSQTPDTKPLIKACPVGDETCIFYQSKFTDEYKKAWKRDYWSQRNVAYMLEDRESHSEHGVIRNWTSACAWRAVIINSRSKEVDESDRINMEFACRRLDAPGRVAASIQASEMMGLIYRRPLVAGFRLP